MELSNTSQAIDACNSFLRIHNRNRKSITIVRLIEWTLIALIAGFGIYVLARNFFFPDARDIEQMERGGPVGLIFALVLFCGIPIGIISIVSSKLLTRFYLNSLSQMKAPYSVYGKHKPILSSILKDLKDGSIDVHPLSLGKQWMVSPFPFDAWRYDDLFDVYFDKVGNKGLIVKCHLHENNNIGMSSEQAERLIKEIQSRAPSVVTNGGERSSK